MAPRAREQRRQPAERLGLLGVGFGPALQRADRALGVVQLVLVQIGEPARVLGARVGVCARLRRCSTICARPR